MRYRGQTIALATMHGKEIAFAPAIERDTGARIMLASDIDTDTLGTFTGEVERHGTMRETAIAKARLGMQAARLKIGLASEGSFGPHPALAFIPGAIETAVLVDDENGYIVQETLVSDQTNFAHLDAKIGDDLASFLSRVRFPSHAVIVRTLDDVSRPPLMFKGLRNSDDLTRALDAISHRGGETAFRIETDMRAHMNPTRMTVLADLAERFAARIATPCPVCAAPGFGAAQPDRGLPCEYCGEPTALARNEISACTPCGHRIESPRTDGKTMAPQMHCPRCNP